MADTPRERSALVSLLADNTTQDVSPQDIRDWLISSLLRNVTTYTTTAPTADDDDVIILLDGTSNAVTLALPEPATGYYPVYFIKAIDITFTVKVDPGTDNLDADTTDYTFATQYDAIIIAWDGSQWWILSEFTNA